jgi:hypothetical protein
VDEHAAQLGRNGLAFVVLHVGDNYLCAVLGQQSCCTFTQAGCAAGDNKNIIFDLHKSLSMKKNAALAAISGLIMAVKSCHNNQLDSAATDHDIH